MEYQQFSTLKKLNIKKTVKVASINKSDMKPQKSLN